MKRLLDDKLPGNDPNAGTGNAQPEAGTDPGKTTTTVPDAGAGPAGTPATEPAPQPSVADEPAPDAAEGDVAADERTRIFGILEHAEAEGRTALAATLAKNPKMDVDTAAAILSAAAKEPASRTLSSFMDAQDEEPLADDGGQEDKRPGASIVEAMRAAKSPYLRQG